MSTINHGTIISDVDLRNDMAAQNTKALITKEKYEAAKRLVNSFHGDEVYKWKENQHRPDFLRNLFVDILGYTKTDSSSRKSDTVTFATEYSDQTGKIPDGILGLFNVEDLDSNKSNDIYPVGFIEVEDSTYGFGKRGQHDRGKGIDQAFDYASRFRNPDNQQRFEIVTNFVELRVYLGNRLDYFSINLEKLTSGDNLEKLFYLLAPQNIIPKLDDKEISPIVDLKKEVAKKRELGLRISADKATKMGQIHSKLISLGFTQEQADKMIVRLAFLMFADDTQIFNKQNIFTDFLHGLKEIEAPLRLEKLKRFFGAVDTEDNESRARLAPGVSYIDGGLFEGAEKESFSIYVKPLDDQLVDDLYNISKDDWSKVNPIVFGSMYEGAMDKGTRHEIGAHYTSEENILKVINNLFMDDLREEFEKIKKSKASVTNKLLAFKRKLSTLTFLDPACGSGNFLILAYRELRRLEHQVVSEILISTNQSNAEIGFGLNDVTTLGFTRYGNLSSDKKSQNWQPLIGVEVNQFSGIELGIPYESEKGEVKYNRYPVDIARAGMWMMDHIMNQEFSETVVSGVPFVRIPLHKSANIIQGDALNLNWNNVVDLSSLNYILGNPPFKGGKTKKGKFEHPRLTTYFPDSKIKGLNNMDFVFGWFIKAAKATELNRNLKVGFVSSNSIVQGTQALNLEKLLKGHKLEIDFAFQTFRWDNNGANVYVVIIGFNKDHALSSHPLKRLITANNLEEMQVSSINEYLLPGKWLNIEDISKDTDLPAMKLGSLFLDNDRYRISSKEYERIIDESPNLADYLHPFYGAKELVQSVSPLQYVFYFPSQTLPDPCPAWLRSRVEEVKAYRKTVSKEDQKLSDTPLKYKRDRYYNKNFLAIPRHTANIDSRPILPMRYMDKDTMISDGAYQIIDCPLWLFVILQSKVHYAWLTIVSGALGSSIRYSSVISYSKFPIPVLSDNEKEKLTKLGKQLNKERDLFFKEGETLSSMYINGHLPDNLNKLHAEIDSVVDGLYGVEGEKNSFSRLEAVLKLVR